MLTCAFGMFAVAGPRNPACMTSSQCARRCTHTLTHTQTRTAKSARLLRCSYVRLSPEASFCFDVICPSDFLLQTCQSSNPHITTSTTTHHNHNQPPRPDFSMGSANARSMSASAGILKITHLHILTKIYFIHVHACILCCDGETGVFSESPQITDSIGLFCIV